MPRALTPAIKKSDTLEAARRAAEAIDHWMEASFEDARAKVANDPQPDESRFISSRSAISAWGWNHEPVDGSENE